MTEENSFLFAEYAKPVAKHGKNKRMRTLLIFCYILFAAIYAAFFASVKIPQVIAVLPVFVWMLIFFTWGSVSYECCVRVSSGKVTLLKLRGKKEKEIFSFDAREIAYALPYNEAGKARVKEETVTSTVDLRADERLDGYAVILRSEGGVTLVRFESTLAVARAMHYYNKEVLVDRDFLGA